MLQSSRVFVAVLFLVLAAAFLAETLVLAYEFRDAGWFAMLTQDSHLFLFFPTFGLVALMAFFAPASAFVDMYFRHVRFGQVRFVIGFAVVAAVAFGIASSLASAPQKAVWYVAPAALKADRSEPAGCGSGGVACERLAILDGLVNIGIVSHTRLGLKAFERDCRFEPLIEDDPASERRRYCFASTPLEPKPHLSNDADCCRAQKRFGEAINTLYAEPEQRSITGKVHDAVLPFKVFFLLMLLVMSVLLAARHDGVARHYMPEMGRIEFGVLAGAIAMVFFPLMSQSFAETASVLYGIEQNRGFKPMVPFLSFAFGAWALLILLFFYHRHNQQMEIASKLAGVMASAIAVVKYDLLVSIVSRFLGAGADAPSVGFLVFLSIAAILFIATRPSTPPATEEGGGGEVGTTKDKKRSAGLSVIRAGLDLNQ